jgi:outer membrane protein assembly factor BamE
MKKSLFLLLFLIAGISHLSSCSHYKMDIQQGNVIEQAQIKQLKRGMSREQVQGLLGTALMQDDFHNNRWDYVFYLKEAGKAAKSKNLTLIFKGGVVQQIIR